jgi:hypothetical protein
VPIVRPLGGRGSKSYSGLFVRSRTDRRIDSKTGKAQCVRRSEGLIREWRMAKKRAATTSETDDAKKVAAILGGFLKWRARMLYRDDGKAVGTIERDDRTWRWWARSETGAGWHGKAATLAAAKTACEDAPIKAAANPKPRRPASLRNARWPAKSKL